MWHLDTLNRNDDKPESTRHWQCTRFNPTISYLEDLGHEKHMPNGHVLFLDAYDSFSNSIVALLKEELSVTVESIKIDDLRFVLNDEAFFNFLDGFDAVVAGPGPGHPANPNDIGLIEGLWKLPDDHLLPVLGICLGFQSLCLAHGAQVERLHEPRHGIRAQITHIGQSIFKGTGRVIATQYHSLHATLQHREDRESSLWEPSVDGSLLPLAWDLSHNPNGSVLMAVRHRSRPFWGLQYHPESICTNPEGTKVVRNWWEAVVDWRSEQSRRDSGLSLTMRRQSLTELQSPPSSRVLLRTDLRVVSWERLSLLHSPGVAMVVSQLRPHDLSTNPILLESGLRNGKPLNPETGRFSIVACPSPQSAHLHYSTLSCTLQVTGLGSEDGIATSTTAQVFQRIASLTEAHRAVGGCTDVPFWGGFVGFVSYEAGLESIDVSPPNTSYERPDIWFSFVERSVAFDHSTGYVYVQSIKAADQTWMQSVKECIKRCTRPPFAEHEENAAAFPVGIVTDEPQKAEYCQKVRECQSQLCAGESYELCLTDQSEVSTTEDGWTLYKRLRKRNPAPFGSYLRMALHDQVSISVVSSSPERFLSWSRAGRCQFRPIKGTVKKAPGVTRAHAEEILGSQKEQAENLMIVDLIRHDLSGVKGVTGVKVPKLMSIEEYETVYQLVSVIEGDLNESTSGAAVLAASLPPGSMTGAPKKRSCEILKELEGHKPRGLYSGVIGYFDVGGGGDFSVVIRTAFRWENEGPQWHVGAGGAITALSDPESEWEEMLTKRESLLPSFVQI